MRSITIVTLFLAVLCGGVCLAEDTMGNEAAKVIRKAKGGGRWFPASARELDAAVTGYMDAAKVPALTGRVVAAMAPHAGFIYSGKVAGYTYRALRDSNAASQSIDTVVVIGFTHRQSYRGVALMDGDAVETPLGVTELDAGAGAILTGRTDRIFFNYAPHNGEHSAENQIPFLQKALPKAKLVVGLVGDHDVITVTELASALKVLSEQKRIIVVASTDLLHDADYKLVTDTDRATLKLVEAMKIDALAAGWSGDRQIMCGIAPVLSVLKYARAAGCRKGTVLFSRNTGDDFPESRGEYVVGYGSAVFAVEQ